MHMQPQKGLRPSCISVALDLKGNQILENFIRVPNVVLG